MIQTTKMRLKIPGRIPALPRRPLPRHSRENNTILYCGVGLVIAFLMPEIGSIVSVCIKSSRTHTVDPFLCPWYHYKIPVYWLIKFIGEYVKEIILTVLVVKLAARYSEKLFTVSLIFLVYSLVDFAMFFWNFATYVFWYWCLLWFFIVVSVGIIRSVVPRTIAQVKSLF